MHAIIRGLRTHSNFRLESVNPIFPVKIYLGFIKSSLWAITRRGMSVNKQCNMRKWRISERARPLWRVKPLLDEGILQNWSDSLDVIFKTSCRDATKKKSKFGIVTAKLCSCKVTHNHI